MLKALVVYLVTMMIHMAPMRDHIPLGETIDGVTVRYNAIAQDIAEVSLETTESEIYPGVDGRLKNAALLVSIAGNETHFWKHIDQGQCGKRFIALGTCDGGRAHSMWQIHVDGGYALLDDGTIMPTHLMSREWRRANPEKLAVALDVDRDRKLAARLALHIIRMSIKQYGDLRSYTGEGYNGPKAIKRLNDALDYVKANPFTVPAENNEAIDSAKTSDITPLVSTGVQTSSL